jgi:steroid 5-alpha reductase family enzyme
MSDRAALRHHRDQLDYLIELASGLTAVGMFAYGVALSYSVLHAIAAAAGLPVWAARLWPLGFEAFMASAALNALAEQRHRRHLVAWSQRVPWYP